ncbi:MAG: right-handed parallel beta-helix repeat-containing protein, partial [Phycisphaerales bacterium]|nr:right-handed parallel beta-helix repeat-containing protein [Phycisphaerales bacterium]
PGPIHDGTSWTSAFTTLPPALIAATFGDQVWVADGTYRPTADADRALSFFLVDGVEMYGGFAGGEFSLFQRNIANHPAILSGDIGVPGLATDNSYHVIFANSLIGGSTIVDGFTITGGRADGPGQTNGGGMTLGSANPVFRNCRVVGNSASASGGGVSCISSLDATFINCDIVNNQAPSGAGLEFQNSGPVLVNCRLIGNVAIAGGGGARFLGSFPTLVNCEIRNNRVSSGGTLFGQGGGMLVANNSIASVTNCTIAGNGADDGGGVLIANSASVSLMNGIVYHNAAVGETGQAAQIRTISGGTVTANRSCVQGLVGALGGVGNIASDPQFDGQFVADPFAFTEAPARLRPGSPCIDAGSVTGLPADDYDLDGDLDFSEPIPFDGRGTARRFDDTVVADTGSGGAPVVDMGANEFSRGALILVDANASGAKTGVTWADAYTDLQEALAQMNDPDFGPGEIWVATGTYRPDESDRAASFDLFIDARLFGGFAGGESARRFRDPRANPTILSGDIGVPNDKGDNSFHVLRADGASISGSTI